MPCVKPETKRVKKKIIYRARLRVHWTLDLTYLIKGPLSSQMLAQEMALNWNPKATLFDKSIWHIIDLYTGGIFRVN